ncbi:MAG: rhodanese-like protein [Bacteroidetes bacterium]|nr:MAG: rhodanese-like protein [Bacteroidota bacterium]
MKQATLLLSASVGLILSAYAQPVPVKLPPETNFKPAPPPALVDYNAYEQLAKVTKEHRQPRLVNLDTFLLMSKEPDVIILDTRSDEMYKAKHVKGAIHLNFADFTQRNLAKIIPSPETRILIYCNNNFDEGFSIEQLMSPAVMPQAFFATKASMPSILINPTVFTVAPVETGSLKKQTKTAAPGKQPQTAAAEKPKEKKPLTLALNIPTYINLLGYGYPNVYELSDLVSVNDPRIRFEGTAVSPFMDATIPAQVFKTETTPFVNFDSYLELAEEVKPHREQRLVSLDKFLAMSKEEKVIILDTRSDSMYNAKHVKGAIHLNFSDFTQFNLAKLMPSPDTKILIYCNNNFENDQVYFATKGYNPPARMDGEAVTETTLTLALNVPTYLNLYGYGYKNVYELNEMVSVSDPRITFEGTAVSK